MLKYEIVKALKEAGFPLKQTPSQDYPQLATDLIIDHVRYQYPTLSELIEACNDCFVSLDRFGITAYGVQWVCNKDKPWRSQGDTPEGAVANLYLEVHKV